MVLPKKSLIFTSGKGINIFKKIKLVLTMPILKNMNTVSSPLLVLSNRVLLLKIKIK
jgi:hypothetical protein